jgi:hypothetical protein
LNRVNSKGEHVVTTNLNLIHFSIFKIVEIRFKNELHM